MQVRIIQKLVMAQRKINYSENLCKLNEIELNLPTAFFSNRKEIETSKLCGCFSCGRLFPKVEGEFFGREENSSETVWFPYCDDTVIGDASRHVLSWHFLNVKVKALVQICT